MAEVTARPPLTVLVATVRGWPVIRSNVERLASQAIGVGGDVVIVDGSGRKPPPRDELDPLGGHIDWISRPGESVFQLRWRGYKTARGDIVAITEDHCEICPGWAQGILDAHTSYPAAGAIGGAVVNATDRHAIDCAAFYLTQSPFMPPLANGVATRISGAANISYKRRVLERLGGDDAHGLIDWLELPAALNGEELVADDSIRVLHSQSQGFLGTSQAEFDNGRTIAGYRRRNMERGDWLRIASSPVLPIYRSVRSLRIAASKKAPRRQIVTSVPAHTWLQYCAMAGELIGYAAGPGNSPKRLY